MTPTRATPLVCMYYGSMYHIVTDRLQQHVFAEAQPQQI